MSLLQAAGEIRWCRGLELEERDPLQRSSLSVLGRRRDLVSVAESLLQAVGEIPWRRGLDLELEWNPCSGAHPIQMNEPDRSGDRPVRSDF